MIMDSVTEIHMRFVYAKVSSSGVAMARLAEKRRQFLAALGERNVCDGDARLMRTHLRIRAADAGAGSRRDVASRRVGGGAARNAPIAGVARSTLEQYITTEENVSQYANYECLTVEVADKVATVTLNRPQARNAINQKLIRELRTIWDDLADDHAVNVVVLTGGGRLLQRRWRREGDVGAAGRRRPRRGRSP